MAARLQRLISIKEKILNFIAIMREVYTERIAPSFILGLFIKEFAIRGNPDAVKLNDLLVFLPSKNCV